MKPAFKGICNAYKVPAFSVGSTSAFTVSALFQLGGCRVICTDIGCRLPSPHTRVAWNTLNSTIFKHYEHMDISNETVPSDYSEIAKNHLVALNQVTKVLWPAITALHSSSNIPSLNKKPQLKKATLISIN